LWRREYRHFETNLGWRPHAVGTGAGSVAVHPWRRVSTS
jgi:hypothetical protein